MGQFLISQNKGRESKLIVKLISGYLDTIKDLEEILKIKLNLERTYKEKSTKEQIMSIQEKYITVTPKPKPQKEVRKPRLKTSRKESKIIPLLTPEPRPKTQQKSSFQKSVHQDKSSQLIKPVIGSPDTKTTYNSRNNLQRLMNTY